MYAETLKKNRKNGSHETEDRSVEKRLKILGMSPSKRRIAYLQLAVVVIGTLWVLCMAYTASRVHSTGHNNGVISSESLLANFSSSGSNRMTQKDNDNLVLSSLLESSAKLVEEGKFHQRMHVTMAKLQQYIGLKQNSSFGGSLSTPVGSPLAAAHEGKGGVYKPPVARGGGLSACLLVKDDNGQLIEWLAYHYHTMPLRYLVVATDPSSVTSPRELLQRWNQTMGMDIHLWDEATYFPLSVRKDDAEKLRKNKTSPMWVHRDRQAFFLKKCMLHHKRHGRKWTLLADSDEFLMFNRIARDDDPKRYQPIIDVEDGMYEYKPMKWPKGGNPKNFPPNEFLMFLRVYLPVTIGEQTIAQHINERYENPYAKRPCITIPRLLISGQENNSTDIIYRKVPHGFNPKHFNTLRFFYHGTKGSYNVNKFGKALVDVSRIKERSLFGRAIAWGHRPLRECGPPVVEKPPHETSLLRINHYLGSMEAFLSRTDERRSVQKYLNNSKNKPLLSYDMQGWLASFVNEVGFEKAKELLEGLGALETTLNKNMETVDDSDPDSLPSEDPDKVLDSNSNFDQHDIPITTTSNKN